MVLKDFPPEDFVFQHGQNSNSQNTKIQLSNIFYRKSIETLVWVIFSSFGNLNSVHAQKKSSGGKSLRSMEILLDLCLLDIITTLPSLPAHSSRRKVRLKTLAFSIFWKITVFSIGNPIVLKIKVVSMKISLNIWL